MEATRKHICPTCGSARDGRKAYCSEECRPVCVHPTCTLKTAGRGDVCKWHREQRRRHGELRPDRWAKERICVVCGADVERGTGRRKHCSNNCQQADSRARKRAHGVTAPVRPLPIGRPKTAVCRLCGQNFSLVEKKQAKRSRALGQPRPRLPRVDATWCSTCDRESPEVKRLVRYGVTPDAYAAALLNGCDICGTRVPKLHIDHDHACCSNRGGSAKTCGNCVRGFLCGPCNRALGMMRDDPQVLRAAIVYLDNFTRQRT